MRNVAPSLTLARRSRDLLKIAAIAVSVGIFVTMLGLALYAVPLTSEDSPSFGLFNALRAFLFIGGVLMALFGVALAVRAFTWKTENLLAKNTGDVLAGYLNDDYTFIRNISQRNLGYIDAVLVGLPGVLVFRILDHTGVYLNEGAKWLKANQKGGWETASINPSEEAIEDIRKLKVYMAEYDLKDIPIYGVVVFIPPDPQTKLTLKNPAVPATHLSSLHARLQGNYLAKDRIDGGTSKAIVKLLYKE